MGITSTVIIMDQRCRLRASEVKREFVRLGKSTAANLNVRLHQLRDEGDLTGDPGAMINALTRTTQRQRYATR
jgi:hypothetical protein